MWASEKHICTALEVLQIKKKVSYTLNLIANAKFYVLYVLYVRYGGKSYFSGYCNPSATQNYSETSSLVSETLL